MKQSAEDWTAMYVGMSLNWSGVPDWEIIGDVECGGLVVVQDAPDCSQTVTWCWEWAGIKVGRWWADFSGEVPAQDNTRYGAWTLLTL